MNIQNPVVRPAGLSPFHKGTYHFACSRMRKNTKYKGIGTVRKHKLTFRQKYFIERGLDQAVYWRVIHLTRVHPYKCTGIPQRFARPVTNIQLLMNIS